MQFFYCYCLGFLAHLTFLAKNGNHVIFYWLLAVASPPNKSGDNVLNKILIMNVTDATLTLNPEYKWPGVPHRCSG